MGLPSLWTILCITICMRFGAVPERLLDEMDLRLPPEPEWNRQVLPGRRFSSPKVYVGAAVWGSPAWSGSIYPLKTSVAKYRQWYPQQFNSIELNATHYNIYAPEVIRSWAEPAEGKDFKFCPKFPQLVSHQGEWNNPGITSAFLESISAFGPLLGPAFLQLSEYAEPSNRQQLYDYLQQLPIECFVEVRHAQWMEPGVRKELTQALHGINKGLLITDTPGRRDLVHMHLTVPKMFLRFVCNADHPSTFRRAEEWFVRINNWLERGLQELYVFVHPGNDAIVPDLITSWINGLNRVCNLQLKPPMQVQASLF